MQNTTATIKTRAAAGAVAIQTCVTFNWENMTADDVLALAQSRLVVKLQAGWRKGAIPPGTITINAADYKGGTRVARAPSPVDIKAAITKLSPEQRAELMAQLQAM